MATYNGNGVKRPSITELSRTQPLIDFGTKLSRPKDPCGFQWDRFWLGAAKVKAAPLLNASFGFLWLINEKNCLNHLSKTM